MAEPDHPRRAMDRRPDFPYVAEHLYRYTRAMNSPAIDRREHRANCLEDSVPVADAYANRHSKAKKHRHRNRKKPRV